MIHPHTGMEEVADKILNDFAEAALSFQKLPMQPCKEVKEKRI